MKPDRFLVNPVEFPSSSPDLIVSVVAHGKLQTQGLWGNQGLLVIWIPRYQTIFSFPITKAKIPPFFFILSPQKFWVGILFANLLKSSKINIFQKLEYEISLSRGELWGFFSAVFFFFSLFVCLFCFFPKNLECGEKAVGFFYPFNRQVLIFNRALCYPSHLIRIL